MFSARFNIALKDMNLFYESTRTLGLLFDVAPITISKWRTGKRPSFNHTNKISKILNVSPSWLYFNEGSKIRFKSLKKKDQLIIKKIYSAYKA